MLINLLTFAVLAVPQLGAVRWTGYVAFIAVLIAIEQIIVEGPRWQMVPANVLTGLFFLVWLLQSTTLAGTLVNRLAAGLAIGLGTLALVISAALPIVSPVSRVQAALRDWHVDLPLDRHLKGMPATLLDGPAAQYPDVRFETRRP